MTLVVRYFWKMSHDKKLMLCCVKSFRSCKNDVVLSLPKFNECLIDAIQPTKSKLEVLVHIEEDLKELKLIMSVAKKSKNGSPGIILAHPEFCPIKKAALEPAKHKYPIEPRFAHIPVSVCVILESRDGQILLTRRSEKMKAFPGVWVPPGGYVDPGETICEAGLREVEEETGLKILPNTIEEIGHLALWESVYPALLSRGSPKRHALVVYYHVKVNRSSDELKPYLRVSEAEVGMVGWFDEDSVRKIITLQKNDKIIKAMKVVSSDGLLEAFDLPLANMCKQVPELTRNGDGESSIICPEVLAASELDRVSTGTKFAMKEWLKKRESV